MLPSKTKLCFSVGLLLLISILFACFNASCAQVLTKIGGDKQRIAASETGAQELVIKVTTTDGDIIEGAQVVFQGGNGVTCVPPVTVTDNLGVASTKAVAGFLTGDATIKATVLKKTATFKLEILPGTYTSSWVQVGVILGVCLLSILASLIMARWVLSHDSGTEEMQRVARPIREGAQGFFKTQYLAITVLSIPVAVILFVIYIVRHHSITDPNISNAMIALTISMSFLLGAFCSGISGFTGMWLSVRANVRVASVATWSYNKALSIALLGGACAGFLVVALSVLGVGALFLIIYSAYSSYDLIISQIPLLIIGYGFGASFVALFAQLGGGIYTKAADVGADIIGKVEQNIPEDDERNPAVIADLVGDNVGDCAGRGADLFESIAAENIGAMILAGALAYRAAPQVSHPISYITFPLMIHVFGLIASWIGIFFVRVREPLSERAPLLRSGEDTTTIFIHDQASRASTSSVNDRNSELDDPMKALNRGYAVTGILATGGFVLATYWMLYDKWFPDAWWHFALCGVIGIVTSWFFVFITIYYTDYNWWPVRRIAEASITGHGTNVIAGIAVGMESTALPVIVISIALLSTYWLGESSGIVDVDGQHIGGLFGTAVGTMGMLATASFILAMDVFGPITDNAGGIVEMSRQSEHARAITDRLDAVGNTTKALTKGYAIGSAALAAFLLFSAYLDEISSYSGFSFVSVNLAVPEVFIGGLLGAALVFLFSSLAIRAVGKTAETVIHEVRRQFQERPGIMEHKESPDYQRCVSLVARSALKQMILPGVLAVLAPVVTGMTFRLIGALTNRPNLGAEVAAAFLMVATIAGILMALFLNNGGGAWDNAKKYIEMGYMGGKGSETHKAAVTGDTVGDPFKDTAGPSIHVLIKLLATITLVIGPLFLNKIATST